MILNELIPSPESLTSKGMEVVAPTGFEPALPP
jgi:hypothetical protein